jgi:hypothetical protein
MMAEVMRQWATGNALRYKKDIFLAAGDIFLF